jgi:hypothetical protein
MEAPKESLSRSSNHQDALQHSTEMSPVQGAAEGQRSDRGFIGKLSCRQVVVALSRGVAGLIPPSVRRHVGGGWPGTIFSRKKFPRDFLCATTCGVVAPTPAHDHRLDFEIASPAEEDAPRYRVRDARRAPTFSTT